MREFRTVGIPQNLASIFDELKAFRQASLWVVVVAERMRHTQISLM